MPVRLRYLAHDLEVPPGRFVIGRSSECQLSLDDPKVSRQHALLTVSPVGVVIEDLGSRNGVLVNGSKISGQRALSEGDRVDIGSQHMTLHGLAASKPESSSRSKMTTLSLPTMSVEELRPDGPEDVTHAGLPRGPGEVERRSIPPSQPDRRVHALSLIGGVADKALALGRAEEAERILKRALLDLLEQARSGDAPESSQIVERAARYAVRLAVETLRGAWIDYAVELYRIERKLLPSDLIDELYGAVRKADHVDLALLRDYLAEMQALSQSLGPRDRFVLQRLEGLEQLAALR